MTADPFWQIVIGVVAALFIGIAKAGFGGGLGILVTPLAALVCQDYLRDTFQYRSVSIAEMN